MVHDQKPAGMIIDGDPDPLSVHRMVVDLLVAMAPVAIQSRWSMRALEGVPVEMGKTVTEQRLEAMTFNVNTCHVWDAEGDLARRVQDGDEPDPPRWAVERLATLGRTVAWWREQRR